MLKDICPEFKKSRNGKTIPTQVISLVEESIKNGDNESETKKIISEMLDISVRHARRIYNKIVTDHFNNDVYDSVESSDSQSFTDEKTPQTSLQFNDKYVYNAETDQYIVFLKSANKNICISGDKHRDMFKSYSNLDGYPATITKMCRTYEFPKTWFLEYKEIFGWTHDKEPVTDEEYATKPQGEIVEDLLQQRRFSTYQKFEKESWKETQEDAQKWREFKAKRLDPFESFLKNFDSEFNATGSNPFRNNKSNIDNNLHYVIGLSDVHFGNSADKTHLFHQNASNINGTVQGVAEYSENIKKDLDNRFSGFKECHILLMGDILDSLTGFTDKGTKLDTFPVGEKQFEYAFVALSMFISNMLTEFPKVSVRCVMGNHSHYGDWALYQCLEKYFRTESNINFEICTQRWLPFKIENSLFIMEHGYSPFYKSKVPNAGSTRDAYVQNLFMSKPEMMVGTNQKYFLTADKHTLQVNESNNFEFIQFSTMVSGNRYADNSNWKNRPRQNALIVNEEGVKEVVNFYFR